MKKLLAVALLGLPSLAQAADGKALFDSACAACHFEVRDPARMKEMVAPPMDMMSAHVRQITGDDRAAFVARVVDYVRAPARGKSADTVAIDRFGLMPPIGDTFPELTDADLGVIADWIFDRYAAVRLPSKQERQRLLQQTR